MLVARTLLLRHLLQQLRSRKPRPQLESTWDPFFADAVDWSRAAAGLQLQHLGPHSFHLIEDFKATSGGEHGKKAVKTMRKHDKTCEDM